MWTFGSIGLFPIGLYTQKIWWVMYAGSLCENGGVRGASFMGGCWRVVLWGRVQCGQGMDWRHGLVVFHGRQGGFML